ncbi:hypothetical protein EWF20_08295 [Sulfolobus sp. S-194]|uniref:hypothetical protein n=1 Tax=Sulfolobus sp. S-194 TaxID=2512240 RepID=UPI001437370F|nr:hypothetical protein [Sulfolobus sp. S-194]QIW24140.1 hypothetical protein EWF20_08295 [Sulfolobus sp. S-194]
MEIYLENSKSKSGKHAIRTLIYVIEGDNFYEFKSFKIKKQIQGIYRVGEAQLVDLPNDKTFVYIYLIKNIKNRVKGKVIVYNNGQIGLVMNYRKLKLKLIKGDRRYAEIIKKIFDKLNIPIKNMNLKEVK